MMKISQLMKRLLAGFALIDLISSSIFIGPMGFFLLLVVFHVLAILQYQKLTGLAGFSIQKRSGHIIRILLTLVSFLIVRQSCSVSILLLFIPLIPVLFFIELFRNSKTPFENIGLVFLGTIWTSLPLFLFLCSGFIYFTSNQYNSQLILAYFIILWRGNSGAYLVGRFAGKHRLFCHIPGGKTREGNIRGLASIWIAGCINSIFMDQFMLNLWLLLALIITFCGTLGDFTKSMLKRNIGVKDSGRILLGHGGILDRFNSLIDVAPFAFTYLVPYV